MRTLQLKDMTGFHRNAPDIKLKYINEYGIGVDTIVVEVIYAPDFYDRKHWHTGKIIRDFHKPIFVPDREMYI